MEINSDKNIIACISKKVSLESLTYSLPCVIKNSWWENLKKKVFLSKVFISAMKPIHNNIVSLLQVSFACFVYVSLAEQAKLCYYLVLFSFYSFSSSSFFFCFFFCCQHPFFYYYFFFMFSLTFLILFFFFLLAIMHVCLLGGKVELTTAMPWFLSLQNLHFDKCLY